MGARGCRGPEWRAAISGAATAAAGPGATPRMTCTASTAGARASTPYLGTRGTSSIATRTCSRTRRACSPREASGEAHGEGRGVPRRNSGAIHRVAATAAATAALTTRVARCGPMQRTPSFWRAWRRWASSGGASRRCCPTAPTTRCATAGTGSRRRAGTTTRRAWRTTRATSAPQCTSARAAASRRSTTSASRPRRPRGRRRSRPRRARARTRSGSRGRARRTRSSYSRWRSSGPSGSRSRRAFLGAPTTRRATATTACSAATGPRTPSPRAAACPRLC
mmetsp:Transcript_1647/g.4008  ORF Transcript_1647/g.4008 Transcript_1647/m.4008 type:complete len:280 (-) Transcript_1647:376-1215(-)